MYRLICIHIVLVFIEGLTMADAEVAKHFQTESIVPESLDVPPTSFITVIYPGNKTVEFNVLTPTDVKPEPNVSWNADPNKLYTLSMIDPDAPSRATPTFREINHWLVVNIKGNDLTTGQTLTPYRGSGPPKGTGLHRYIFIVFEQPGLLTVTEPDLESNRRNFSIRKFAEKYNLGKPIAGNFYQAEWDQSVPERRA